MFVWDQLSLEIFVCVYFYLVIKIIFSSARLNLYGSFYRFPNTIACSINDKWLSKANQFEIKTHVLTLSNVLSERKTEEITSHLIRYSRVQTIIVVWSKTLCFIECIVNDSRFWCEIYRFQFFSHRRTVYNVAYDDKSPSKLIWRPYVHTTINLSSSNEWCNWWKMSKCRKLPINRRPIHKFSSLFLHLFGSSNTSSIPSFLFLPTPLHSTICLSIELPFPVATFIRYLIGLDWKCFNETFDNNDW